ncbi:MAG TPA: FIST C-terminal domain-containing protein [Burkholderiales bacterium]|nr:FIST C-terminal domain-containing protein [Burkholderiales bacterium]
MIARAGSAVGFRAGHARADRWRDAAEASLRRMGTIPPGANLGFLYLSDRLAGAAADVLEYLKQATGVADWVGTVGVGVLATGIEYFDEPALTVMLATLPEGEFKVFSGNSRPPPLGARTASGAEAAHFAIVHGDPNTDDMPELIEDMSAKVASGYLVGGLSSSRARTFQLANEVLQGGLSGVVLSSRIGIATRLTQGCSPLRHGPGATPARHVVTEGERNIIVSLDGRPALDVLREDTGGAAGGDLPRAAQSIHVALPVPGSDTGDYLVRNLVGIDPQNKLIAIGAAVENGMPILFCRRDRASARDDLVRMLEAIGAEFDEAPRGGLYFSCLGRGEHMFGTRSAELGIIRDRLGEFPLVGFFCNGEISHDRLYGYTGVLTLFR